MEHNFERLIKCPYCDWEDDDSWEIEEEESMITCGNCGKEFNVLRQVEVTYSTSRIECNNGDHNYKLESYFISKRKYINRDWINLPESEWEYFRIEVCEECEHKVFIKISKEEYYLHQ